MANVVIKQSILAALVDMANSHIEDIEGGLEDGMYEASENEDLPEKQTTVEEAEHILKAATAEAVRSMVDASTGHLSGTDQALLERAAERNIRAEGFPRTISHEYGWSLFLTGNSEEQTEEKTAAQHLGASASFVQLLEYAHQVGAYILNFDANALPVDGVAWQQEEETGRDED